MRDYDSKRPGKEVAAISVVISNMKQYNIRTAYSFSGHGKIPYWGNPSSLNHYATFDTTMKEVEGEGEETSITRIRLSHTCSPFITQKPQVQLYCLLN